MAEFDVDLFVIGGGSGGVRAARIAAGYGARVMVAEEYRMGGTCVIRGCVPKKLFVIGSHIHHGIEHVISSNEAFHLPELPKRIVIQGGGYIALEFAGIFAGFGSDVTVIYRGDNILRGFDEDVRAHVRTEMEKQGITILTGCTVNKGDKHGKEFTTRLSHGPSVAPATARVS